MSTVGSVKTLYAATAKMCTVRNNESALKCENTECYYNTAQNTTSLPTNYGNYPYELTHYVPQYAQPEYAPMQFSQQQNFCYQSRYEGMPPCAGPQPWDYGYCYGAAGSPCQFIDVVDMEDFM